LYIAFMPCRFTFALASALALATFPALAGTAADNSQRNSLPGVKGGYSIVTPVEADPAPATKPSGKFKVGDIDVHVSGSVIIDVGIGSVRAPRH
jgi:hypothetical protein